MHILELPAATANQHVHISGRLDSAQAFRSDRDDHFCVPTWKLAITSALACVAYPEKTLRCAYERTRLRTATKMQRLQQSDSLPTCDLSHNYIALTLVVYCICIICDRAQYSCSESSRNDDTRW